MWRKKEGGKEEEKCVNEGIKRQGRKGKKGERKRMGKNRGGGKGKKDVLSETKKEGRQIFWMWRKKEGGKEEEKCINEGMKRQGRKGKKGERKRMGKNRGGGKGKKDVLSETKKEGRQIFWVWRKKQKRKRGGKMKRSVLMKGERGKEERGKSEKEGQEGRKKGRKK